MNAPTQQEKPEHAGQDEHDDGLEEPALEELAQSRYEEAAERGDDIPSRSLSSPVVSCRFEKRLTLSSAREQNHGSTGRTILA
jgi:hypothetical protein